MNPHLEVVGLNETVRALRRVDAQRTTSKVHKTAANTVRDAARRNLTRQPVPNRPGMITSSGTQRGASVVLKYSRYPYAAGAEFGALRYRQFRPWVGNRFSIRANQGRGYMIGQAIADNIEDITRRYADELETEFQRQFDAAGP